MAVLGLFVLNCNIFRGGWKQITLPMTDLRVLRHCADQPCTPQHPTPWAMQRPTSSSSKLRVRSWDMEESLETMTLKTVPTRNGSVFVTWTNFGYVDFAVTWAENLRRNGIENMYIGAMDVKTSKVRTFGRVGVACGVRDRWVAWDHSPCRARAFLFNCNRRVMYQRLLVPFVRSGPAGAWVSHICHVRKGPEQHRSQHR